MEQIFGNISDKTIIYVGDHEGDIEFARNIGRKLNGKSKVIAIVAKYSGADTSLWKYKADFEIDRPSDLVKIINNYS